MLHELRERITAYLLKNQVCLLTAAGANSANALPVWYRLPASSAGHSTLAVECLLPRWVDLIHYLEHDPRVFLIIYDVHALGLRWLQFHGVAHTVSAPDWETLLPRGISRVRPHDRYQVIHIRPDRIDLIDESSGWGSRQTIEL